ncbi:hypothetical protein HKX23_02845 [Sulfitobacter sp. KE29]|uniref:Uncharacterized protein n=1 Tax=Sulfitobacter faviae TaxID=1775881 RepID=A0ABZ0UXT2_9RHOB|nr:MULTISPECIES: hypothetical protein [Sulfitobacter]MBO9437537.1 hypothetical protein [Sulfitobacter sp. R18_2]MDF3417280.1 hypothetical protein [Sulfitobacter sp. Ks38]MDF3424762.1 hypothetical protein [Sulfitobacter sp. KE29]MDF3428342.1 hypothetical protein [Sulfitobacter sp. S46]MDF3443114.1 hypothetical protein [Sulfitobacter sp. KE31]|tara:strand:- start:58 stop:219 length:162 start_codon:yes stop_codon:yes gene_type:complete
MKKQRMAVSVRALGMYFAERDFGNTAQSASDKAAQGFLQIRTAAVPSKNLSTL